MNNADFNIPQATFLAPIRVVATTAQKLARIVQYLPPTKQHYGEDPLVKSDRLANKPAKTRFRKQAANLVYQGTAVLHSRS